MVPANQWTRTINYAKFWSLLENAMVVQMAPDFASILQCMSSAFVAQTAIASCVCNPNAPGCSTAVSAQAPVPVASNTLVPGQVTETQVPGDGAIAVDLSGGGLNFTGLPEVDIATADAGIAQNSSVIPQQLASLQSGGPASVGLSTKSASAGSTSARRLAGKATAKAKAPSKTAQTISTAARSPCGYDVVVNSTGKVVAQLASNGMTFTVKNTKGTPRAKLCLKQSANIPVNLCRFCTAYPMFASQANLQAPVTVVAGVPTYSTSAGYCMSVPAGVTYYLAFGNGSNCSAPPSSSCPVCVASNANAVAKAVITATTPPPTAAVTQITGSFTLAVANAMNITRNVQVRAAIGQALSQLTGVAYNDIQVKLSIPSSRRLGVSTTMARSTTTMVTQTVLASYSLVSRSAGFTAKANATMSSITPTALTKAVQSAFVTVGLTGPQFAVAVKSIAPPGVVQTTFAAAQKAGTGKAESITATNSPMSPGTTAKPGNGSSSGTTVKGKGTTSGATSLALPAVFATFIGVLSVVAL